jgi:uncharacterized damage-inducible protein DinB
MTMPDQNLLEPLLDSWNRNNTIMLNLLRVIPEKSLGISATENSATIAALFMHMIYIRLVHVYEDAPEFSKGEPEQEWADKRDKIYLEQMLNESAKTVHDAVKGRLGANQDMNLHYDHPILMLQHLIWHEGYHHGQIKLVLKLSGHPVTDTDVGEGTWGVWMDKTK